MNAMPAFAPPNPRAASLTAASDGLTVRLAARRGDWRGHTSGLAAEHVQANLVLLPADLADDFLRYCQANAQACPLLAVSEPGDWRLPALAADLDLRSDLPRYRVWRHGELVAETTDLTPLWRDDLVSFAIGCSFSFEHALLANRVRLRHIEEQRNVAMYRTNIATVPAGLFHGPLVVSMRPLSAADAQRAAQITAGLPELHGAPVHVGDPARIGIADLDRPDHGEAMPLLPGELPVFWACGVTPQAAIQAARPAFCITHAPGHMLVTDLLNRELGRRPLR